MSETGEERNSESLFQLEFRCDMSVSKHLRATQENLCHRLLSLVVIVKAGGLTGQNKATGSHYEYNRK